MKMIGEFHPTAQGRIVAFGSPEVRFCKLRSEPRPGTWAATTTRPEARSLVLAVTALGAFASVLWLTLTGNQYRWLVLAALIGPSLIGFILPTAGQSGVFALGAGAFALAALVVLVLGEETKGRTLESISH